MDVQEGGSGEEGDDSFGVEDENNFGGNDETHFGYVCAGQSWEGRS